MPCNVPTTTSPGFLKLDYEHNGLRHSTRFGFIVGVDIADITNLRTEAIRLASALKGLVPSTVFITDWEILNPDGSHNYGEPFATPLQGAHGSASGFQDYWSDTVCIKGVADGNAPGNCVGRFSSTIHVGKAFQWVPGQMTLAASADAGLDGYITALNISTYVPADKYGQQGSMKSTATIQFNSHTQRTKGS